MLLGDHPECSISLLIVESQPVADDRRSFFVRSFNGCQDDWLIATALISRKRPDFGLALDSLFFS